jgi:DNA-directed RNA polymerase specialized sigma subunit
MHKSPSLTTEQSELAGRYYLLAMKLAHRRAEDHPERFEAYRDGAIDALIRAARNFDPTSGMGFGGLARTCVIYAMMTMEARSHSPKRTRVRCVPMERIERATWDPAPDDADLESMIAALSAREKQYIRLRFRDGLPLGRPIRARMKLGYPAVKAIERSALETLRGSLAVHA